MERVGWAGLMVDIHMLAEKSVACNAQEPASTEDKVSPSSDAVLCYYSDPELTNSASSGCIILSTE